VKVTVIPDAKAARRFHEAMQQIRKISGRDFETVIKSELSAVLTGAVRRTKKATSETIKKNHDNRPGAQYGFEYAGPESRSGKTYSAADTARARQRAAERRAGGKNGKLVYYFSRSKEPKAYPAWLWRQIQEQRAKSLVRKTKARGLAASMFVRIGDKLGISVKAPGYVKNAKHHKRGEMAEFVDVQASGSGDKYEVGFVNNLTRLNRWAQAGTAFRQSLNARATYFGSAVKLQASKKIKQVLDRYPGLASMS